MRAGATLGGYYRRLAVQVVTDCRTNFISTLASVVIAVGAAYLQVTLYAFPWPQTWLRSLTTAACAVSVFCLYLLYYIIRAPWKLYVQDTRQSIALAALLEPAVRALATQHSSDIARA